jgi:hypothetical protein
VIIPLSELLELVGKLDDSEGENTARERFRRHLKAKITKIGQLRDYLEECLRNSGIQYSRAYQDLLNHLGHFLGFEVTYGAYQGDRAENGFDGHWISTEKGCHIVIEIANHEIYPINTSRLITYLEKLIFDRKIPTREKASGLYVSNGSDRNIEEISIQIIAENKTNQLRIVFLESLLYLAEMMHKSILSHEDILLVLRPSNPNINAIIDLVKRLIGKQLSENLETSQIVAEAKQYSTELNEDSILNNRHKKRPRRVRLRRGDATPPKAFYLPILKALEELGGSAKVSDVLERVEQLMR